LRNESKSKYDAARDHLESMIGGRVGDERHIGEKYEGLTTAAAAGGGRYG